MYRAILCVACALALSGCATSRYNVAVTSLPDDKGGWVAVRVDQTTGEASYYRSPHAFPPGRTGEVKRIGGRWVEMK